MKPVSRSQAETFDSSPVTRQPLVYEFAAYLAEHYGCSRLIALQRARASKWFRPGPGIEVFEVDLGLNKRRGKWGRSFGEWISHGFRQHPLESADPARASAPVVVCAGAIEHVPDPGRLLANIRSLLEHAPVAILTAPERDLCIDQDPPGRCVDACCSRGWGMAEFRCLLENAGLEVMFHGLTFTDDISWRKHTILAVVRRPRDVVAVPPEFRVVALVAAYNEEDVIEPLLRHTIKQGVEVFLLDYWSTDRTAERAAKFLGRGVTGIAKFPETGPLPTYDLYQVLKRKEELAHQIEADWFIHLDADEIRESPWPGLTIREALYRVQTEGFNAVNHACLTFHPTGGQYREDSPLPPQFPYFEFGTRMDHFCQVRAWKRQPVPVQFAESGGHDVCFPGRRVYPFRFLLRHYAIRSQEHGEKKVLRERLPRFSPAGRQRGWHIQYDGISEGRSFLRDPSTLMQFKPATFYEEYLVERLSGLGKMQAGTVTAAPPRAAQRALGPARWWQLFRSAFPRLTPPGTEIVQ